MKVFNPINLVNLIQKYESGISPNKIAKDAGVSRTAIRNLFIRNKVQIRNNTEANGIMMSQRTKEENIKNTEAAHKAVKGKPISFERLCNLAITREKILFNQSPYEVSIKKELEKLIKNIRPQFACGKYNIDILTENLVATEIYGGGWHLAKDHIARDKYIIDQGFDRLDIWISKWHVFDSRMCVNKIISMIDFRRSNPTSLSQYQMIWCDGTVRTFCRRDSNGRTIVVRNNLGRYAKPPNLLPR